MTTDGWPSAPVLPRYRCSDCGASARLEAQVAPWLADLLDSLDRGDRTSRRRVRLARGAKIVAKLIRVRAATP